MAADLAGAVLISFDICSALTFRTFQSYSHGESHFQDLVYWVRTATLSEGLFTKDPPVFYSAAAGLSVYRAQSSLPLMLLDDVGVLDDFLAVDAG
jgi:hypothetical protein